MNDSGLKGVLERINSPASATLLERELDELLQAVRSPDELVWLMSRMDVDLTAARACWRRAQVLGGSSLAPARWLPAGAFSLEGMDDVALAIEPEQQRTGFITRAAHDASRAH